MEIWKKIPGVDNYSVSNYGNVRRDAHQKWSVPNQSYSQFKTKLLTPSYNNQKGYARVQLHKDGKRKIASVHRLVAQAFIENPHSLPQVNHKDNDKTNNHVSNLEWCTNAYNMMHRLAVIGSTAKKGSESNFSKLTEEQVRQIPHLMENHTLVEIGRMFSVSPTTIGEITKGRTWTHLGLFDKQLTAAVRRTQEKHVRLRDSPTPQETGDA